MRVRVTQSFDGYRRGDEFDWPRPMVKILSARGLVQALDSEPEPAVEAAVAPEQATERAAVSTKPRRRRK